MLRPSRILFMRNAFAPQLSYGRFRKQSKEKKVASGKKGKGKPDPKSKAYGEKLLKALKYKEPKDKRSEEEREEWKKQAAHWNAVIGQHERHRIAREQERLDLMWEAIEAIPDGPLKEAATTEDYQPPPKVMRGLTLAEVGPIPEEEVERLKPHIIDHTPLRRD